jgi:hypothetical protein
MPPALGLNTRDSGKDKGGVEHERELISAGSLDAC